MYSSDASVLFRSMKCTHNTPQMHNSTMTLIFSSFCTIVTIKLHFRIFFFVIKKLTMQCLWHIEVFSFITETGCVVWLYFNFSAYDLFPVWIKDVSQSSCWRKRDLCRLVLNFYVFIDGQGSGETRGCQGQ